MNDGFDLDKLTDEMNAATPAPDTEKRARNITRARENFEKLHAARQGNETDMRPTSDRPETTGFISGVKQMFTRLSPKGILTATTSFAALGLVVFVVLPEGELPSGAPFETRTRVAEDTEMQADLDGAVTDEVATTAQVLAEPVIASPMVRAEAEAAPSGPSGISGLAQLSNSGQPRIELQYPTEMPGYRDNRIAPAETNTESFANAALNAVKITAEAPVSTFSIDVDTASYALVRSSLNHGVLPPPEAVRAEEMINYFPYAYTPPIDDLPFATSVSTAPTPWNDGTNLVHIAIQGELPEVENRPPLNLVFLIDTSGSMNAPDKLPLLIASFRLMLSELHAQDSIAIVTYAGSAGTALAPTPANDRTTILNALENLRADGSTAGQAGLRQAYSLVENMTEAGEISRVILATDGDFNIGLSDPEALKAYIADKRDSGTYLSVLGFGRGNLDDTTLQALAQNGNGTAAYIDTLEEAQKTLVDQLSGALFPIANDVKIQVEFNPALVAEYRLIGYETRALRREDFNNDAVDAGEIGAGHRVTALYEVTPVGSEAVRNDPLRYGRETQPVSEANTDELGFLRVRYKNPGETTSNLIETPIRTNSQGIAATETGFAAAIAGFAQLLQGANDTGGWSYDAAIALATQHKGADTFGYRAGAITLMRLAQSLSQN